MKQTRPDPNNDIEEMIPINEAQSLLGVSAPKMSQLIKDRVLECHINLLDRREKLVRRSDVLALKKRKIGLDK